MPIVVKAVSQEEFDAFIAEKKSEGQTAHNDTTRQWSKNELMARGEEVYGRNCVGCHQKNGKGIPNMFPAIAGSDIATGDIDRHLSTIVDGVEGTPMQSYREVLSDVELAAVITYQRNALGNAMGDAMQPYYVKRMLQGGRDAIAARSTNEFDFLTDTDISSGVAGTGVKN